MTFQLSKHLFRRSGTVGTSFKAIAAAAAVLLCASQAPAVTNTLDHVPYTTGMWSVTDWFGFGSLSNALTRLAAVEATTNSVVETDPVAVPIVSVLSTGKVDVAVFLGHTNNATEHTGASVVTNIVRALQTFQGTLYGTTNASTVIPLAGGCRVLDNVPPAGTSVTFTAVSQSPGSYPFSFSYDKGRVTTILAGTASVRFWASKTGGPVSIRPELHLICTNGTIEASYTDAPSVALANSFGYFTSDVVIPSNTTAASHCRLVLRFLVTSGTSDVHLQVDDAKQLIVGVPVASGNYATGLELLNVSNVLSTAVASVASDVSVLQTGKVSQAQWVAGSNSFATAEQGSKADAALPAVSTNGWTTTAHAAWLTTEADTNALASLASYAATNGWKAKTYYYGTENITITPTNAFTFDGLGTITAYNQAIGGLSVVVPYQINGVTVTNIGGVCFQDCGITNIIAPTTVFSVVVSAFGDCASLVSVSLPQCSYIGEYAFNSCASLVSVNLPQCSYIGEYAFGDCASLVSVNLPQCSYIGFSAFDSCASLVSVNLPQCSYVGEYAFNSCSFLVSVYFGSAPPTLGTTPFAGCTNTVYHLAGYDYGATFGGRPTAVYGPKLVSVTGGSLTNATLAGVLNASGVTGGVDFTSAAYLRSKAPSDGSDVATADWVRGLLSIGNPFYSTTNRAATAFLTNVVYWSSNAIPADGYVTASIVSNNQYAVAVMSPEPVTGILQGPASLHAWLYIPSGAPAANYALSVKPELYYTYNTNTPSLTLGDWSAASQSITPGATNLYQWTLPFPNTSVTGAWVVAALKVTSKGSAANSIFFFSGTNHPSFTMLRTPDTSSLGTRGATNMVVTACPAVTNVTYDTVSRTFTLAGPALGTSAGLFVYSTISTSAATIVLAPSQTVYSVTVSSASVISNDMTGLNVAGKVAQWTEYVNFTTTNALDSTFATNTFWACCVPTLTVTGTYTYACSTLDGVTVVRKQTFPTLHQPGVVSFVNGVAIGAEEVPPVLQSIRYGLAFTTNNIGCLVGQYRGHKIFLRVNMISMNTTLNPAPYSGTLHVYNTSAAVTFNMALQSDGFSLGGVVDCTAFDSTWRTIALVKIASESYAPTVLGVTARILNELELAHVNAGGILTK